MGKKDDDVIEESLSGKELDERVADGPQSLSEEEWPATGEDGEEVAVGFVDVAGSVLNTMRELGGAVASYAGEMADHEGVLVHQFGKAAIDIAKQMQDDAKENLITLAGPDGGDLETENGTAKVTVVKASTQKIYTEETMNLLESKDLLPSAVAMVAEMKEGIDVESISESEMAVLEKYFDIELVPDSAKIDGLIALGKIKAVEVNETLGEEQVRAGHSRLTVKPSETLAELFGIE